MLGPGVCPSDRRCRRKQRARRQRPRGEACECGKCEGNRLHRGGPSMTNKHEPRQFPLRVGASGREAPTCLKPCTPVLFDKVLVANRGEIARRVMRTCKRLGIRTVAVYSEADKDAPHVSDADEAVLIGPPPAKDSYLNADALVAAIKSTGARAVHPGYGFLSEKPAFARAVAAAGAVFVGPPPAALEAFGDKMKARHVALAAGTQPVPGTDEPIAIETPAGVAEAARVAERVGYPVVVKAVGG